MTTYRITFTSSSEDTVEISASSVGEAWNKITSGNMEKDKDLILIQKGKVTYKAKIAEEITKRMATIPSTVTS